MMSNGTWPQSRRFRALRAGNDAGPIGQETIDHAARHPWNTTFEWTSPSGGGGMLGDVELQQFDGTGYVVVSGVLEPDLVEGIVAELDSFERETDMLLSELPGGRRSISERGAITFTPHLACRSPLLRSLTYHPTLVGICTDLMADDVDLYWDQAVYKNPEKPRPFPWHQDNGYTFVVPQQYLTFWIALTDATIDNGCPVIAPGYHRLGTLAHRHVDPLGWECLTDPSEAVAAQVSAGGVVVFSSLTPHCTGPNVTDTVRKAYIIQYTAHGATVLRGDPTAGPPTHHDQCDSPERNYPILRGGRPVGGEDLPEPAR